MRPMFGRAVVDDFQFGRNLNPVLVRIDDEDEQVVLRIPGSCRPRFREIVAHRSELKSPGIPI
jgi:hypothetical protein